MNRILYPLLVLVTLLLALGQPTHGAEWNPTASDVRANTAGGTDALLNHTSAGLANTAFGYYALKNSTGYYNTASGAFALYLNTTGDFNTASGYDALLYNTTGSYNTASGAFALYLNTTGNYNTASGYSALSNNTTGAANTASGHEALRNNTTGWANTVSGYRALYSNTTGAANTASGATALFSNTTGSSNTASGVGALYYNTTGSYNTASGGDALYSNTTGSYNTASGYYALKSNTTGYGNTASGYGALYKNTTGGSNTSLGRNTLYYNTTGHSNTASGYYALNKNTTGVQNTAFGRDALKNSTTGSNNLGLGMGAGSLLTSGGGNIYLGHPGTATESNTLRLGNTQTRAFVAGVKGKAVTGSAVYITSNGQLGVQVSSARYKQDIAPLGQLSEPLHQLRPVAFHYKQDPQGPLQYGLLAEEVAMVYPELVTRDTQGEVEGVRYEALIPLLLNEVQLQRRQLSQQAEQFDTVLQQLAELRAQNESLRAAVGRLQEGERAQAATQVVAVAQPLPSDSR